MPTASRAFAAAIFAVLVAAIAHFLMLRACRNDARRGRWPGSLRSAYGGYARQRPGCWSRRTASIGIPAGVISVPALTAWPTLRVFMCRRYHGAEHTFKRGLAYITRETEPLWSLPVLGGAAVGVLSGPVMRHAR